MEKSLIVIVIAADKDGDGDRAANASFVQNRTGQEGYQITSISPKTPAQSVSQHPHAAHTTDYSSSS